MKFRSLPLFLSLLLLYCVKCGPCWAQEWDSTLPSFQLSRTLSTEQNVRAAIFSSDGHLIAVGHQQHVSVWTVTGEPVVTFDTSRARPQVEQVTNTIMPVLALAFSEQTNVLGVLLDDASVQLWSVPKGQFLHRFVAPKKDTLCFALSPDGKTLATASKDHHIYLWDTETGQLRATCEAQSFEIVALAFSDDETLVSVGAYRLEKPSMETPDVLPANGQVTRWDAKTGIVKAFCTLDYLEPHWVVISPRGNYIATRRRSPKIAPSVLFEKYVTVWETHSGNAISAQTLWYEPAYFAFSQDENYLIAAGSFHTKLDMSISSARDLPGARVWDIHTNEFVAWLFDPKYSYNYWKEHHVRPIVALSAENRLLFAYGPNIKLWWMPEETPP